MNKEELLKEVRERAAKRLPKPEWARAEVVATVVEELFSLIVEKVHTGEEVRVREFGKFYLKGAAPRIARNPKTGEKVKVPARKVFAFKPSKKIKFVEV